MPGISLCLDPHYMGNFQELRSKSIPFLHNLKVLSPSHILSMNWDRVGLFQVVSPSGKHTMNPTGTTLKTGTSEMGRRTEKALLPDHALEGAASLWGWTLRDKWAILKAVDLPCSPHVIHQWTICRIINAICKSEADSPVQKCKNKSAHILAWHRQQKATWNNTRLRRIKASHFLGTATWKWQSKYEGLTV